MTHFRILFPPQTLTVEQDPFVPTPQDLAGFWDMVYIQVEHIHLLFAELAELRANGWKRKVRCIQVFVSFPPAH